MSEEKSTPSPSPSSGSVNIASLWLSRASKERICAAMSVSMTDGIDNVGEASLVVVSTRLPRVRMASVMRRIEEAGKLDVTVVACHAGGEETALDLVRLGARHVMAEGNEATLRRLQPDVGPGMAPLDENGLERKMPAPDAEPLVSGFTFEIEQSATDGRGRNRLDPVTQLPTGPAFSLRFADLTQGESLPRVAFIRLANRDVVIGDLERQTLDLFRRRLAMQMRSHTEGRSIELFQLEDVEFAFIASNLSHDEATTIFNRLVTAAEGFAPSGSEPVRLAIGHAGPEVANEPRTLRELAGRATQAAAASPKGGVVGGDELALSEANATEIESMLSIAARVDTAAYHGRHHHHRVADICVAVGRELGVDGIDLIRLRLAGRLHDIGQIDLDDTALASDPSELSGDDAEKYRNHPVAGAGYVSLSTSSDVVDAIRHHHEHWDGSGFPDGKEGDEIPFAARVVALADHIEDLERSGATPDEIVAALEADSGVRHDPGLVWAGVTLVRSGSLELSGKDERELTSA